jgi:hypothetical protein
LAVQGFRKNCHGNNEQGISNFEGGQLHNSIFLVQYLT